MSDESQSSPKTGGLVNVNIEDVFGLGKVAAQLSPAASKIAEGLNRVLDPALSAAKIFLEDIAAGAAQRHNTKKNIQQINRMEKMLSADPALAEQMKARLVSTEMRRQANIHSTTMKAIELANRSEDTGTNVDLSDDFVQEWIEGVKDVSNEDVQSLWAALMANAPSTTAGRVSKPAIELLKQFDQATALMLGEYVKVWFSVGFPSTRTPVKWSPFGTEIDLSLLTEIGVLNTQSYSRLAMRGLGELSQVPSSPSQLLRFGSSMDVYSPGARAFELCSTIFNDTLEIDGRLVLEARKSNLDYLSSIETRLLGIARSEQELQAKTFVFAIGHSVGSGALPEIAHDALDKENIITPDWIEVLRFFATEGRLRVDCEDLKSN